MGQAGGGRVVDHRRGVGDAAAHGGLGNIGGEGKGTGSVLFDATEDGFKQAGAEIGGAGGDGERDGGKSWGQGHGAGSRIEDHGFFEVEVESDFERGGINGQQGGKVI